jgi:hypothetical protein
MQIESRKQKLKEAFQTEKVLEIGMVKEIIGTTSRMTVFRKLKELGYYSSYSHSGKYYTLGSIPVFDRNGLWSYGCARFSNSGTLMDTISALVKRSEAGYFAAELLSLLQVFVHNAVGKLFVSGRLLREQISDQYLYLSPVLAESQFLARKKMLTLGAAESISIKNLTRIEMVEHLNTFLSTLNEKQRRLYLGFESIRLGHGGDVRVASVAGINVKTVSRGRKELLSKEIDLDRVRRRGAGRPPLKKTRS